MGTAKGKREEDVYEREENFYLNVEDLNAAVRPSLPTTCPADLPSSVRLGVRGLLGDFVSLLLVVAPFFFSEAFADAFSGSCTCVTGSTWEARLPSSMRAMTSTLG